MPKMLDVSAIIQIVISVVSIAVLTVWIAFGPKIKDDSGTITIQGKTFIAVAAGFALLNIWSILYARRLDIEKDRQASLSGRVEQPHYRLSPEHPAVEEVIDSAVRKNPSFWKAVELDPGLKAFLSPNAYKVLLGGSLQLILKNEKEVTLIEGDDGSTIKVKIVSGKMLLSVLLHSFDGKIVAEIKDNEWQVNPNNYFKRNYDKHAFEVVDPQMLVKLQFEYLDTETIRIRGFFKMDSNYVSMSSHETIYCPINMADDEYGGPKKLSGRVPLMFRYPADRYLGVRADQVP